MHRFNFKHNVSPMLLFTVGLLLSCALPGCGEAVDQQAPAKLAGDIKPTDIGQLRSTVSANLFAYAPQPFTVQGTKSNVLSVAQPAGYSKYIPIVQIRKYQVGDKDYAFQFSQGTSGGYSRFNYAMSGAPDASYGVANLVGGEVGVLALSSAVQATGDSPRRAKHGETINWSTTGFASGTAGYFRSLWSVETGGDDDFEFDSWFDGNHFFLKGYNGNGLSFVDVQSVELAAAPGLGVSTRTFDLFTEGKQTLTISTSPSKKHAVLASADSMITCGADQFSFDISCSDSPTSPQCTITSSGGTLGCSRVQGWMVVIESY